MQRMTTNGPLRGCRLIPRLGIAALIAFGALPVGAAEPAAAELVEIFAGACLAKFPDDADVRQFAREKQFFAMPEERLRHLLGTDPGEGWIQNGAHGQYLLTIEFPPYHTCAIRVTGPKAPDFLAGLSESMGSWAASQTGTSLKGPSQKTATVGGVPSQVYLWEFDRGQGKSVDTLMAIVSNLTDVTEVRLVHGVGNR
jgi:hypothetical protein